MHRENMRNLWGMRRCNSFHHRGGSHTNLMGDYLWRTGAKVGAGKFKSLRPVQMAWRALLAAS